MNDVANSDDSNYDYVPNDHLGAFNGLLTYKKFSFVKSESKCAIA